MAEMDKRVINTFLANDLSDEYMTDFRCWHQKKAGPTSATFRPRRRARGRPQAESITPPKLNLENQNCGFANDFQNEIHLHEDA